MGGMSVGVTQENCLFLNIYSPFQLIHFLVVVLVVGASSEQV